MRNLMRVMILGTLVLGLYGCGKGEEGGSIKNNTSTIVGNGVGAVYQDFNSMREAFTNSAMNTGLNTNTVVYHIGPLYGGTSNSSSFSASASFCVFGKNLLGNDDVCSGSGNTSSQLNDAIDMGQYKVVRSANANSVAYGVASSVSNGTFSYLEETFDSNDSIYRKMLNLDNLPTQKIVVTEAQVRMSTGGQMKANFVEYFFEDGTYEAYILSAALPVMANPIASYKGNFQVNGGVSFKMEGRLNNIAQNILSGVSAQSHRLENDFYTGQLKIVRAFTIR